MHPRAPQADAPAAARRYALALLWLAAGAAEGARPMATDDTGTAPAGSCQIEAWSARAGETRALTLAPACGLADRLELDSGIGRSNGAGQGIDALALGLKWAPEAANWHTPLGVLSLGLIGGGSWARDDARGWHGDTAAVAGLASLQLAPHWSLNLNVIGVRALQPSRWASGWRGALAWQPDERWLLFAETLQSSAASPVRNAGARWWLLPQVLGLDLVLTRADGGNAVGLGFGWYGIFGR